MRVAIFTSIASSLLLALSYIFPGTLGFLVFFALAPIFYSLLHSPLAHKSILKLEIFLFTSAFLASTFWIYESYPLDWLGLSPSLLSFIIVCLLWGVFSLFLGATLIWVIHFSIQQTNSNNLRNLLFIPSIFVVFEYVRSHLVSVVFWGDQTLFGSHHTYYSLAYPTTSTPFIGGIFSTAGLYGVVFFVIVVNLLFAQLIKNSFRIKGLYLSLFCTLAIIFFATSNHHIQVTEQRLFNVVETHFGVALTSSEQEKKWSTSFEYITRQPSADQGIWVLPENINLTGYLDRLSMESLYIGSVSNGNTNTLYYADRGGLSGYNKRLLMPIGEYEVFILQPVFRIFAPEVYSHIHSKYIHAGSGAYSHTWNNIQIGGLLCSENISPILHREMVRTGADILINIASQTPFHGSELLARQTLAITKARSYETGRVIIVSSNMSKSFVFDPGTDTTQFVDGSSTQILHIAVLANIYTHLNLYMRFGDIIVLLAFVIVIFCVDLRYKIKKQK